MISKKSLDAKRHYLPASAIGYFSPDNFPERLRERSVWVLRKNHANPNKAVAESVGYGKHIYGYGKGKLFDHDDFFRNAEANIHTPVDKIMQSNFPWINAGDWAKLAWYITIQIAREPDLEHELEPLVKKKNYNPQRIGVGYPLNAQRISTAVIRARWEFVCSPDRDFILGDRGITGIYYPTWKTNGYFMPLRKDFGVILGPAPYKKQLKWFDNAWHIEIDPYTLTPEGTDKINQIMWHGAHREVYGSSEKQLLKVKQASGAVSQTIRAIAQKYEGAMLLGLSVEERMKDELLLLKILGEIKKPNDNDSIFLTI